MDEATRHSVFKIFSLVIVLISAVVAGTLKQSQGTDGKDLEHDGIEAFTYLKLWKKTH